MIQLINFLSPGTDAPSLNRKGDKPSVFGGYFFMGQEIWKDIKGFEGEYKISNYGNVKSVERFIFYMNPSPTTKRIREKILRVSKMEGYLFVTIKKNILPIHILVWDHFGNSRRKGRKIVVDHIDENKSNSRIDNLQLLTHQQNILKHYSITRGKYPGVSKKRSRWAAYAKHEDKNKKTKYIGTYDTPELAYEAYLSYNKNISNE